MNAFICVYLRPFAFLKYANNGAKPFVVADYRGKVGFSRMRKTLRH